jgi:hypothetical protein
MSGWGSVCLLYSLGTSASSLTLYIYYTYIYNMYVYIIKQVTQIIMKVRGEGSGDDMMK